jgi:hypothetical protein
MKNSNDTIGNRIRELPACSAVPQPTVQPRDPYSCVQTFNSTIYTLHAPHTTVITITIFVSLMKNTKQISLTRIMSHPISIPFLSSTLSSQSFLLLTKSHFPERLVHVSDRRQLQERNSTVPTRSSPVTYSGILLQGSFRHSISFQ